jgi:hypothetical protein
MTGYNETTTLQHPLMATTNTTDTLLSRVANSVCNTSNCCEKGIAQLFARLPIGFFSDPLERLGLQDVQTIDML